MSKACWLRNCPCQTGSCSSSQPTDDGCPVYRWFSEIFKSKWISVKDRLPEKSGEYIVYCEDGYKTCVTFSARHQAFNACDHQDAPENAFKDVTHWMPLPENPEADEAI